MTCATVVGRLLVLLLVGVVGAILLNNHSYRKNGRDFRSILMWQMEGRDLGPEYAAEIAKIEARIAAGHSLTWPEADFGPRVWAIEEEKNPGGWLDHYKKHLPLRTRRTPVASFGGGSLKFLYSWKRCLLYPIEPIPLADGGHSPPMTIWFEPPDFLGEF